jgi:hypothetical protein
VIEASRMAPTKTASKAQEGRLIVGKGHVRQRHVETQRFLNIGGRFSTNAAMPSF